MRKEINTSGWRLPVLFLSVLILAVTVQACGGSSKDADEPKQEKKEGDAKQALEQAIEAEKAGQVDAADEHYERARELRPQHLETAERYTRFLLAQKRPEDAVRVAKEFLEGSMSELQAYYLLAEAQVANRDYPGAHETLSQLIELEANEAAAYARRGEIAIKQEKFEEGLTDIRKAVELSPQNPDHRVALGKALQDAGDLDAAAKELAAVLQEHPEHVGAHLVYGAVLRTQGKRDDAFELHKKAVELADGDPMAHYELGISQFYLGKNEDAQKSLQRAMDLDPDDAQIRYVYGEVLRNLKSYEEAAQRYREALERDPAHDKATTKLGLVLTFLEKNDEAVTVLKARVAEHREDAEAHYLLGTIYEKQEKFTEAVEAYDAFLEVAAESDPNVAEARRKVRLLKRKLK
jgi:tetratricopeptide (TPR) repeat protein